ncbi:hypothetical protein [Pantoea sp. S62]|uniref:hypothetical protein n=1 Tax=Pantoea sp. S62 TaxID=2769342 RepID=UPI001913AEB6|nr:hypothetical protein [Pantoea sp. S62]MBK5016613.1 hypothetical protein [Pantoea sp. S62]
MTISANLADMLQLANYECDMLTALAYQRFCLDDLDEQVPLYGELPVTVAVQINVIYNLEFGMVQDRFISPGCADLVDSIRAMSIRLDRTLHERISSDGHNDGLGDLEIARLESFKSDVTLWGFIPHQGDKSPFF